MELLQEVDGLLDILYWDRDDPDKRMAALLKLQTAVACEACVEEVRRLGGVERLRKVLINGNDDAVDLAAALLASCSGATARGPGVRTMTFGEHGEHAIPVRETDYVEGGLGWRVWASGVVMCRELIDKHAHLITKGTDLLEVGAGCGVVGFLAARLGAKRVTFTDYLPGLLSNLDQSIALNDPLCPATEFRVRHLEWLSAVPGLSTSARPMGDGSCTPVADAVAAEATNRGLPSGERYSLILGSDVCYEDPLPRALAHVLSQRLATPGLAWLVLPAGPYNSAQPELLKYLKLTLST